MPEEVAAKVKVVLADIDDTITTDGVLTAAAYTALENLHHCGIKVAPVTGRPAGWCDMIARFWPVDGVVGENGAFYYAYDKATREMRRRYHDSLLPFLENPARFDRIKERVVEKVPGAAISADQPFRIADLAIDFCEDVAALDEAEVTTIKEIFEEEGATAKISSIHVNGWYGVYDKLTMARAFCADILAIDIETENSSIVFVGDSPNDAPMFAYFDNGCGVANVADFIGTIDAEPTWIARGRGGSGFIEIANHLISARAA